MFLRYSRPTLVGITAALLVALTAHRATAQVIQPVSRTLLAQASAPPVTHNPPDVVIGPVFGPFTNSATAQGNPTSASITVNSDLTATRLAANISGNVSGTFMGQVPGSSGSVLTVFNLPSATTFQGTLYRIGGQFNFNASATVRGAAGGPIHFQQDAAFVMTPPSPAFQFTLPAGQYEARFSGAPNQAAGTGGGGAGFFELIVVPKPTGGLALAGCALLLVRQRSGRASA